MSSRHEEDTFTFTSSLQFHLLTATSDVLIVEMHKIQIIRYITMCQLVVIKFLEESSASIFRVKQPKKSILPALLDPEDGSTTLKNISNYLPHNMAVTSRKIRI
jgi:hypothetical protein